jgi:hypothetical protein
MQKVQGDEGRGGIDGMRWFKHLTNSSQDEKLCAVLDELGLEGYGFYWRILEVIALQMDKNSKTFCEYSPKIWGKFAGISAKKFENFIRIFQKHKLFSVKFEPQIISVNCHNLAKYKDEYCSRGIKEENGNRDKLPIVSGQTPEEIQRQSIDTDIEKEKTKKPSPKKPSSEYLLTKKKRHLTGKRLESFLEFWNAFGYKKGKAEAADAWMDIPELTRALVGTITDAAKRESDNRPTLLSLNRTPIYAQGWISARRWEDEDSEIQKSRYF